MEYFCLAPHKIQIEIPPVMSEVLSEIPKSGQMSVVEVNELMSVPLWRGRVTVGDTGESLG